MPASNKTKAGEQSSEKSKNKNKPKQTNTKEITQPFTSNGIENQVKHGLLRLLRSSQSPQATNSPAQHCREVSKQGSVCDSSMVQYGVVLFSYITACPSLCLHAQDLFCVVSPPPHTHTIRKITQILSSEILKHKKEVAIAGIV